MKKYIWTIILSLMVLADSLLTIYIGEESNHIILWMMNFFNLTLEKVMYIRLLYYIPLIWIVHKWNYTKFCVCAYFCVYIIGVIATLI